jgi:hypothetical protein
MLVQGRRLPTKLCVLQQAIMVMESSIVPPKRSAHGSHAVLSACSSLLQSAAASPRTFSCIVSSGFLGLCMARLESLLHLPVRKRQSKDVQDQLSWCTGILAGLSRHRAGALAITQVCTHPHALPWLFNFYCAQRNCGKGEEKMRWCSDCASDMYPHLRDRHRAPSTSWQISPGTRLRAGMSLCPSMRASCWRE